MWSRKALPVEPEIPASAREGKWDGEFTYEYDEEHDWWRCTYVAPDKIVYPFDCGKLLIGMKSGVKAEELSDLFQTIDATVVRNLLGEPYPPVIVTLPVKSEREALIRAARDSRLRYASLSFTGPATCGAVGICD